MNFLEMLGFGKKDKVEGNNPATPVNQAPPPAGMPFGNETDPNAMLAMGNAMQKSINETQANAGISASPVTEPTPIQPVAETTLAETAQPVETSTTPTQQAA